MKIEQFLTGIISTNLYVVYNEETKHGVIIDPANCPKKLVAFLEEKEIVIDAILLTHGHFDHIMGIDKILERYGKIPVYIHEDDLPIMTDTRLNQSAIYTNGYSFDGCTPLKDGQDLLLAGACFHVIHTPGHTMGGACYYVANQGVLFCGDTLFLNSVGRTDFENSSTSAIIHSVKEKLFLLPDDTICYPGHMGATTIGHEKECNPYV